MVVLLDDCEDAVAGQGAGRAAKVSRRSERDGQGREGSTGSTPLQPGKPSATARKQASSYTPSSCLAADGNALETLLPPASAGSPLGNESSVFPVPCAARYSEVLRERSLLQRLSGVLTQRCWPCYPSCRTLRGTPVTAPRFCTASSPSAAKIRKSRRSSQHECLAMSMRTRVLLAGSRCGSSVSSTRAWRSCVLCQASLHKEWCKTWRFSYRQERPCP